MELSLGAAVLLLGLLFVRIRAREGDVRSAAITWLMAGSAVVAFATCALITTLDAVRHARPILVGKDPMSRVEGLGYGFGVAVTLEVAGLVWSCVVLRSGESRVEALTATTSIGRIPAIVCAGCGLLAALAMRFLPWGEEVTGGPHPSRTTTGAPAPLAIVTAFAAALPLWARDRARGIGALPAAVLVPVIFGVWATASTPSWEFKGSAPGYGGVLAIAFGTGATVSAFCACFPRSPELDPRLEKSRAWAAAATLLAAAGFLAMFLPWQAVTVRAGADLQHVREKWGFPVAPDGWGLDRAIVGHVYPGLWLSGTQAWFGLFATLGSAFGVWFSVLLFYRLDSDSPADPRVHGFLAWCCSTLAAACVLVHYYGFTPRVRVPVEEGSVSSAYGAHVALVATLAASTLSFLALRALRGLRGVATTSGDVTGCG